MCGSAGALLLIVRGLRPSGSRSRSRGMVMPELCHQDEQFYPHGLESLSKGMTLSREESPSCSMHTNPALRGETSAFTNSKSETFSTPSAPAAVPHEAATGAPEAMSCSRAQSRRHDGEDTAAPGTSGHHPAPRAFQVCGAPDSDVPPGWCENPPHHSRSLPNSKGFVNPLSCCLIAVSCDLGGSPWYELCSSQLRRCAS
jgi:hypothetical protein